MGLDSYLAQARELVAQMTLEEKSLLCSGQGFWELQGIERLGLDGVMVNDGPHGLRKQAGGTDQLGLNESVPATCFPAACATACSFDRTLLREVGAAIAEECLQEKVSVVLGPGVNIKRNPLCGRNFEYFSEDPLLAGELGAALVEGIQSLGIGASVKHFAANNQETRRAAIDSVVDMRALREIYLAPFERIVKQAQPWTVMCSYNKVNGVFASDNRWLLGDVLRGEWGFEGAVISDWGATNDRVAGVRAGLDLEMPGTSGRNDKLVAAAVRDGSLPMEALDALAVRVCALTLAAVDARKEGFRYDAAAHHALAQKASEASCVLLKNEAGLLPIEPGAHIALIGSFAKAPRYQGAGSSKINPTRIEGVFDALCAMGVPFSYAEGYLRGKNAERSEELIEEACALATGKEAVIIIAGLPEDYESEGFDRKDMRMPASHVELIERVAAVNPHVAVVLQLGAPVELPWEGAAAAILVSYLGGQAAGGAVANLLLGRANPCGKLAETWPRRYEDTPSYRYFPGEAKTVEYRESVFVGYRYFDTAGIKPAYPFGFGLSYTTFTYSDLVVRPSPFDGSSEGRVTVRCTVANTGERAGAEIVQLYVGLRGSKVFRARKELRGFAKVELAPGERKAATFTLERRSFAYYNSAAGAWAVEGGRWDIFIGASSADIRLVGTVDVKGDGSEAPLAGLMAQLPSYFALAGKPADEPLAIPDAEFALSKSPAGEPLSIPDAEFAALYGKPLPPAQRLPGEPFTANSTMSEIQDTFAGRVILAQIHKQAKKLMGDTPSEDVQDIIDASILDMPLRSMMLFGGDRVPPRMVEGMVDMANGKLLSGLIKMWRKD